MQAIFVPSVIHDQRTRYHTDIAALDELKKQRAAKSKKFTLKSFRPKSGRPRKLIE